MQRRTEQLGRAADTNNNMNEDDIDSIYEEPAEVMSRVNNLNTGSTGEKSPRVPAPPHDPPPAQPVDSEEELNKEDAGHQSINKSLSTTPLGTPRLVHRAHGVDLTSNWRQYMIDGTLRTQSQSTTTTAYEYSPYSTAAPHRYSMQEVSCVNYLMIIVK
jgi:hypothetical protein